MANRVIAISRQYGAGGHFLAEALSNKLGIPYYDQDLINEIAVKTGLSKHVIRSQGEAMESGNFILNALRTSRFEADKQEQIWDTTRKIIRDLAEKEPCIILGRCANYILRNRDDVVSVYLHADYKCCAENVKQVNGYEKLPTEEELGRVDKRRAAFYRYYTDWEWDDAKRYTITLDFGKVGLDKCVEIVESLYNA